MVKALLFKGDKKPAKKRKRAAEDDLAATSDAKQLTTASTDDAPEDEDSWTSADLLSDIAGPVLLLLPATPLHSVSVDSLGRVFAQKIENAVEGQELASAEPHDVRQVWVANRVVGSEDTFTFKGHHGRYLGSDKYGICAADNEAMGPNETFTLVEREGGFDVQTIRKTFLSVKGETSPPELRGDTEEAGNATRIHVRMQAKFKPKTKVDKAEKVRARISRKELEDEVGRRLDDDEVKKLKKARRDGSYHEAMLDVKVKGKHDKFA